MVHPPPVRWGWHGGPSMPWWQSLLAGQPSWPRVDISDFLLNLRTVAASPYAFAAYVGVAAAWTYTTVARHRLDRIAQLFKDLPPDDRIRMIMREYSTVPRSGLSAEQWIVSRRHTLFFVGFLSLLVCTTIIAIIALVHATFGRPGGSDDMTRLDGIVRMQGQENLAMRQEIVELKRELNALRTNAAGLKASLSSVRPSRDDGELVARMQDVGRTYGFRDPRIEQTLADPALTAEDKLALVQVSLMRDVDADIEEQMARVNELQRRADRGGTPSIDVETMKLKRLIDRRAQMFDALRHTIDRYNQTARAAIDAINR
ncbi:MAG TPA: hypothetical protein VKE26_20100 [Xanthobacteraceae bacterium]|nr:hypothetical protein [Xanthobacteraceae bacterium]